MSIFMFENSPSLDMYVFETKSFTENHESNSNEVMVQHLRPLLAGGRVH
jgi:hypothetical protein